MPYPIGFTDTELDIIVAAAGPIDQEHQPAFYEAVASALAPHPVIGEGLVHRTWRELQRRFVDLPHVNRRGNLSRAWRG
jgi:hypothetical protein